MLLSLFLNVFSTNTNQLLLEVEVKSPKDPTQSSDSLVLKNPWTITQMSINPQDKIRTIIEQLRAKVAGDFLVDAGKTLDPDKTLKEQIPGIEQDPELHFIKHKRTERGS